MSRRIAYVSYEGSPLQAARLATLAERFEVHSVEVVRKSSHYAWGAAGVGDGILHRVLFEDSPGERAEESAVAQALDEIDPDVVFAVGYGRRFARAAIAYAHRRRKPLVVTSASTRSEADDRRLARLLKSGIVSGCAAGLVAGRPQARQLASLGLADDRIFAGYDVVDNDRIAAAVDAARSAGAATAFARGGEPYFLCVSRLVWQKNLPALLQAMAAFRQCSPAASRRLLIAGYGPLREEIQTRIDALDLNDRVEVLGAVPYDRMPELYAGAAALILPSISEPWGLVVNEAMAAGLPVAVSDACGCAEDLVAVGENGFVFRPDDIARLAEILGSLDADEDLRRRFGQRSREIVGDWSLARYRDGATAAIRAAERFRLGRLRRLGARAALSMTRLRPDRVRGFEQ